MQSQIVRFSCLKESFLVAAGTTDVPLPLTRRDYTIICALRRGESKTEIASLLGVTLRSVQNALSILRRKQYGKIHLEPSGAKADVNALRLRARRALADGNDRSESNAWRELINGDWKVIDAFAMGKTRCAVICSRGRAPLSRQEREVLALFVAGCPTKEMADYAGMSTATVNTYIQRASRKLGLRSSSELRWLWLALNRD